MVNYACGFNQSETGKYFERIIIALPAAVDQILNQWRQKCSPLQITEPKTSKWRRKCSRLQIIEPLTEKTWGQGCVVFGERKKQRAKRQNSFKKRGGVIHLGLRPLWITPSLICRILHILRKPNSIIAKYIHDIQYTTNSYSNGQGQREKKRKIHSYHSSLGPKTDQRHPCGTLLVHWLAMHLTGD